MPARTPPKRPARLRINSPSRSTAMPPGSFSGLRGARPAPAPEQVDGPRYEGDRHRVVQEVEVVPYHPPVLAQYVAEVGQREDPGDAPEGRVEGELGEVHP